MRLTWLLQYVVEEGKVQADSVTIYKGKALYGMLVRRACMLIGRWPSAGL